MDFTKLSDADFAKVWREIVAKIQEDPIKNFIVAKGFMDFTPTPAQTVALKIIFNKDLDPETEHKIYREVKTEAGRFDLLVDVMTEYELYKFMTGKDYEPNTEATDDIRFNMINLIIGRRGGKTTLSAMLAIYCAISTNWKPYLKKTPFATVLVLSHTREFSDEIIELIRSLVEASPVLSRMINKKKKNTASTLNLVVPWIVDGKLQRSRVQIKTSAASSKSTRGVAACAVLCDEIAFWNLEENLKESDQKIMKAVRPATKQFGSKALIIKLSSPGIKQGVLYGEYLRWEEGTLPHNYIIFKAPSWVWNTILPKEEFIIEWELDEDGFDTEYRANFVDSLSNFILPEFTDMAVLKGVEFLPPEEDDSDVNYIAAIDAAFKSDRFTFTVVGVKDGRIRQYIAKGWQGSKKEPVSIFEVAEYIRVIAKQYDIHYIAADQFAFQPLKEIFDKFGLTLEEYVFNPAFKKKIYYNLKKIIHGQQIDLLDCPVQTKEIKELVVEQTATGTIRIGHPAGGSDDYSDSLSTASYLAIENVGGEQLTFNQADNMKSYGVKVDIVTKRALGAPSPELLVQTGHLPINVVDNVDSEKYVRDPYTNKLRLRTEEEIDEDDSTEPTFLF